MPRLIPSLLATIAFSTLIAAFLTAIGFGGGFAINMVFSQCIGLSIGSLLMVLLRLRLPPLVRALGAVAGVGVGALIGGVMARLLTGVGGSSDGSHEAQSLLLGLVFGAIAAGFFWLRERNTNLEQELQAREVARLEAEKQGLAAQLRLLQAQVEPHFLFNSLANVAALVESDPKLAGTLLDALIRYLRSSLTRTRDEGGTLGDEMALLTAFLDILKIRMGRRLAYSFEISPELLSVPFPPMLLQPLVENAVRHGLEPKLDGGCIAVSARRDGERLHIAVRDDGLGFADTPGSGIGVTNIRARLEALYGSGGRLELAPGVGGGVSATLTLPLRGPA